MTLSRSHRRLSGRAFLGAALLAALGATWLPCAPVMAQAKEREAAPATHRVDVAGGSPDSRVLLSRSPASAPLLAWRKDQKTRPPDAPGPAPVFLPRTRYPNLEQSVLLI